MSDFRISVDGEGDLQDIWHFIAEDDPLAASGFIAEFFSLFDQLQNAPMMGRAREDLQRGIRLLPHRGYLIFYHVAHNTVHIDRVMHGARDYVAELREH